MAFYKPDPNDSKKQVPITDNPILKRVGHATAPAENVICKRPTYVVINGNAGSYQFAYESGSISTYITGSVIDADASGPVKLDINPVAWMMSGTAGKAGDITFVYRSR
jgi:hypothetical protein